MPIPGLSFKALFGEARKGLEHYSIGDHEVIPVASAAPDIRVVESEELFVSEPNPAMFGNEPNPSGDRSWTNWNWLQSRFHFRFAECHRGPIKFGVLRVLNDDLLQPARGFGAHGHQDMEIVTLVVEGHLTHRDSMGENETLPRGSIQFMSAGTGVRHSEHNLHKSQPLRFIQCWIEPRHTGTKPNYGSMFGDAKAAQERFGHWAHLVSDVHAKGRTPVQINQDCNVHLTELSPGASPGEFHLLPGRQAYLLCVEGMAAATGGAVLRRHDAAELKGPMNVTWRAGGTGALLLLFEMALTADSRYKD